MSERGVLPTGPWGKVSSYYPDLGSAREPRRVGKRRDSLRLIPSRLESA